jgi:hypothetical protein
MDFVDNIITTITNYDDSKNKYDCSLQLIIVEYTYSKCHDCKVLLKEEDYKCNNCDLIRCKFHHTVNADDNSCVECQSDIIKNSANYFRDMCKYCSGRALFGFVNDIMLCKWCVVYKNEYPNIINFSCYCDYKIGSKRCCGTGWFTDKITNKNYCIKHKNENCDYNYVKS